MLRVLRADLHRLFRSPVFYITPAFMIGTVFLSAIRGSDVPFTMGLDTLILSASQMMSVITMAAVCVVMIFLWTQENRNGFIKNIAGNVRGRHIPTLSKLITGAIVTVIYTLATFLFVLFGNILNGGTIVKADAGDAIVQVLLWMLTGFVALSLMLLLFETTKSSALCYIATLLFWTKMIEELIIQLFYFLLKIDNVGRYLIIYGNVWENSGTVENFIRNALYLAVFGAAALIIAKKSDVR